MSMPLPPAGAITPNPPVNTGSGPDVQRAYPCDAPGTVVAGWRKTTATGPGGWDAIDDADDGAAGWEQT